MKKSIEGENKRFKRSNPKTGKPFRSGFLDDETGLVFKQYEKSYFRNDGFYAEIWITKDKYEKFKEQKIIKRRQWLKNLSLEDRIQIAFNRAKLRSKKDGREFSISLEYLISLYPKTGICPVLGTKMEFGGQPESSPSIDRIDNTKGYIEGNVAWISNKANSVKGDSSIKDILSLAEWLKSPF